MQPAASRSALESPRHPISPNAPHYPVDRVPSPSRVAAPRHENSPDSESFHRLHNRFEKSLRLHIRAPRREHHRLLPRRKELLQLRLHRHLSTQHSDPPDTVPTISPHSRSPPSSPPRASKSYDPSRSPQPPQPSPAKWREKHPLHSQTALELRGASPEQPICGKDACNRPISPILKKHRYAPALRPAHRAYNALSRRLTNARGYAPCPRL